MPDDTRILYKPDLLKAEFVKLGSFNIDFALFWHNQHGYIWTILRRGKWMTLDNRTEVKDQCAR